jgi:nucleoside-diphosphate-sugar epimerase
VSSVLVYAPMPAGGPPIAEHHPRHAHGDPSSRAYGQDCIDAEDVLMREWSARGLTFAILRPAMLFGSATANVSSLLLEDARRQPFVAARRYAAAGVMQWVDVRDAARAVVLAATAPTIDKDILTIAGSDAFTAPDVVRAMWQEAELEDARPLKFDIARAGVVLGWRPECRIGAAVASAEWRAPGPPHPRTFDGPVRWPSRPGALR